MADLQTAFPSFNPSMRIDLTQFNFVIHNMFCLLQPQTMATFCPHTIFSSVIPILLSFVVLEYSNQDKSPFQTHPKTVLLGILSLLLYCFSNDFLQRIRVQGHPAMLAHVFHRCILFFGYLAMAALASLLFPDSASPVFYALHITISVGDVLYLVYRRIRGAHLGGRRNSPIFMMLRRILAQRNPNQGHLLPL